MDVTDGVLGNKQCTQVVLCLDRRKRTLYETHGRVFLGRDDRNPGHGLALRQGREKVSEQRIEAHKLHIVGNARGVDALVAIKESGIPCKRLFQYKAGYTV
jgi:hypothetical protein